MFTTAQDGTKLWYDTAEGPRPVLLLHGFASDSTLTWERTGWTRALAEHGHVTLDLRGHGQSDRANTGYAPDDLAVDVLAVLDAAGLATVDVVTYSMGGLVGWHLARRAPERVRRMVLGGVDGRVVDRESMLRVEAALSDEDHQAVVDGVAGHGLDGVAPAPVLFAAGEKDEFATGAEEFAAGHGAPFVSLGARNHFNAVTSRVFKRAALDFFGES